VLVNFCHRWISMEKLDGLMVRGGDEGGLVLAVASGAAHAHDSGFLFFLTGVCQTFFCDYERYPGSSSRAVPYWWGGYCADPAECG
jgi:hypothetical protein